LEELLSGLNQKQGILDNLDMLLDDKPVPQFHLHRKRQVLVSIEKLVLRLLPSPVQLLPREELGRPKSWLNGRSPDGKGHCAIVSLECTKSACRLQLDF